MPAALPLSSEISQSSSGSSKFRVLRAKYGNGYEQRAADGINNATQNWEASWENMTSSQFSTLVAAFDAAGSVDYFTWTPPGSATSKKFIVASYSVSAKSGDIYSVSASLEQVY